MKCQECGVDVVNIQWFGKRILCSECCRKFLAIGQKRREEFEKEKIEKKKRNKEQLEEMRKESIERVAKRKKL